MEAKLTVKINGRDIIVPVNLTQEDLRKILLGEDESGLTGWEAPQIGQMGYYENEFNQVVGFEVTEDTLDFANDLYENDNFFSTEETAKNTIRADNVLRRLLQATGALPLKPIGHCTLNFKGIVLVQLVLKRNLNRPDEFHKRNFY